MVSSPTSSVWISGRGSCLFTVIESVQGWPARMR